MSGSPTGPVTPESIPPEPAVVAAAAPPPRPAAPGWLRIWRTTQPTPPEVSDLGPAAGKEPRASLLFRKPFPIGFFLTAGAMSAFGLVVIMVQLKNVLVLVMLALALALGLNPIVEWLHHRGIRRGLSVLLVALGFLALLGLAGWAVFPVASEQVNRLIIQAPTYLDNLRQNPQIAAFDAQFHVIDRVTAFLTSGELIAVSFGGIVGAGAAVANMVFSVIMTVVLTLYFLASLPAIKEVVYQLAPASRRPRVRYLATEMFNRVGGYVTGMFLVVMLSSSVAFLFLNIVGLTEYALALAVVVAIFAFVPLVGTTISMVIVSVVAYATSPTAGLITLIFFLVYQQFDAYFVQPRIFSSSVQVPGVMVILAAMSGGFLLGIVGAVLAIPVMAALLLLYREVLVPHLDRR